MATLQDTVEAVLLELRKQGKNLQKTDLAESEMDFALLLGFKENGDFVRLSPEVLRGATKKYLTLAAYKELERKGEIKENVEYNIFEDE